MTPDKAFFCPACSSACLEVGALAQAPARCELCGWEGVREELHVHEFVHESGSSEEMARAFFTDLRAVFGRDVAASMARVLEKWGFLPEPDVQSLARYLVAMVRAATNAVIEERQRQEKARHAS
ncbi:hypothetical protein LVJ94_35265 [Pendulispora rubella]|uniref:Uncharacterized protein n=1 Tax=Pendulispora rubella TaxID=2741070 RepID=A0ABZ2KU57_9BACT